MNKSTLRKHYLARRKALSQESITEKSQAICDLFFQHFNLSTIEYLHIFLPIIRHHEINTFLIIDSIQQEFPHVQLVVPKSIPETNEMEHYLYDKSQLVENKWGIPEPIPTIPILPIDISMVIVPLLIFDKAGNRVGYGKGFYDRFLKQCSPELISIGLCLEEPVDKIEDVNEFDVKINYGISPNRLYSFS